MLKYRLMILLAAVFISFFVVACGTSDQDLQPNQESSEPFEESESVEEIITDPSQVVRTSLEDAFAAFEAESAVFIDVRDQSSFEKQHIPGSLNIPESDLLALLSDLEPDSRIITICT